MVDYEFIPLLVQ